MTKPLTRYVQVTCKECGKKDAMFNMSSFEIVAHTLPGKSEICPGPQTANIWLVR